MVPEQKFSNPDLLDIVFENRNKAYGAYQLRRDYPRSVGRALGVSFLLILTGLALPLLLSAVSKAFPTPPPENAEIVMGPPPDVEKMPPPPTLPAQPPPPSKPTQIFLPPVVMQDDLVSEKPPHTVEELILSDKSIGQKDTNGDPNAQPTDGPDTSDFGRIVEYHATVTDDKVYSFVDVNKMPGFPGGEKELLTYLAKNINYPALARENDIQGIVAISFVIEKDGAISNVMALKDIGGGLAKEAIRVVQSMPPWNPGEANGHPVKVRFVLPVRFKLQ